MAIDLPALGLRAKFFQFDDKLTAQTVQFADGHHHFAGQIIFKLAEFERRAAEATELFPQFFFGQRKFFCFRERHRGFHFRNVTFFVTRNERQRFADETVNFNLNRALKFWRVARETLAQTLVEFGIVGFPNFIADVDAQKINAAVAETQFGQFLAGNFETRFLNFVNASAFLFFIRLAGVENNSIAEFHRHGEIYNHAVADNFFDFAKIDAAFFPKACVNEFLIINAAEPAGEKAARERHF